MLQLDAAEFERLKMEIERTLEYFAQMAQVDVDDVPATTHIGVTSNRTRPDTPSSPVDPDELLQQAPDLEDRFIPIPNVL